MVLWVVALFATSAGFAEGRGDAKDLVPTDGQVKAWNADFPVVPGVERVRFSPSDASLTFVVRGENTQQTLQTIKEFYQGKTVLGFVVGQFVARDDFMPDAQGFSAGKRQRSKGLSIFLIPQGNDVVIYIHPFKK